MTVNKKNKSSHKLSEQLRLLMQEDIHFRDRVQKHLLKILKKFPRTFDQLLRRSLNCDPALLLRTINELQNSNIIYALKRENFPVKYCLNAKENYPNQDDSENEQDTTYLNNSLSSSQTEYLKEILEDVLNSLPEPTPVYSQWWYSKSIYENIIKLLLQISKPHTATAFIGASTLGAIFSHFSKNNINILDVDEILLEEIIKHTSKNATITHYDVSNQPNPSFIERFKVVFVDPPWSSKLLKNFLIRSSTFVSIGGTLVISFPPILTRPAVEKERKDLFKLAKNLGLSLKSEYPGFTEYSVPLFEQKAYEHYGIHLKNPWRRGDLFLFTKLDNSSAEIMSLIETTPDWNQYHFGKRRLFLKRDGLFEDGQPSVHPIPGVEDLMYKSASTRMTSWKSASLISTHNHIALAYGRRELSTLLEMTCGHHHSNRENNTAFNAMIPAEIKETISSMFDIANSHRGKVSK